MQCLDELLNIICLSYPNNCSVYLIYSIWIDLNCCIKSGGLMCTIIGIRRFLAHPQLQLRKVAPFPFVVLCLETLAVLHPSEFSILHHPLFCHAVSTIRILDLIFDPQAPGFRTGAAHHDHHLGADPPAGSLLPQFNRKTGCKACATTISCSGLPFQGLPASPAGWIRAEPGSSRHQRHRH